MESVWTETAKAPEFGSLDGDIKTDVLIIGGGIAGILCAYELKKAGVDYVLIEAKKICDGITKNTTAKITSQHGLIYHDLIKKFGADKAREYYLANQNAVEKYRKLCADIDCDFEDKPSYVYSTTDEQKIEDEMRALQKIGCSAQFVSSVPLPFSVAGAVKFDRQAQFNPLKFIYAIARELNIYENTKALEFLPDKVVTDKGNVKAKKIIVATHFPILNKHGMFFIKMYQHRSYVTALRNAAFVDGMYVDEDEKGLSFRNYGDLLLLGGGSHRTGEKGGNWQELTEFAKTHYKDAEIVSQWATQDCMTLDGAPYIGQYSVNTPNLFVTTGFNKWGMTSSLIGAEILTDLVMEKENRYAELFCPSRSVWHPRLAVNLCKTVLSLLTPTVPRCPHMGCALKYNPQERSWDCACHGSRFTTDKKLIDNPATDDMK
ncbi:MAG: FAD-dependent oxidoreductase [Christensenellales bacterium]